MAGRGTGSPGGSTFLVRVLFRQNATWQGTVQWLDEKKSRSFRSMLEMVVLMEEALNESGGPVESRSWERKEEVS